MDEWGLKGVLGAYVATNSFFGAGDRLVANSPVGLQFGVEKQIIHDKLMFQADFISGQHALGEAVIGAAYKFTKHWILSAGYQVPTFGSSSVNCIVFELTYVPMAHQHDTKGA